MKIKPTETIVAKDRGWKYDLYLVKVGARYRLRLFMKVQFFFRQGSGGSWSDTEEKSFVLAWTTQVKAKWETGKLATDKQSFPIPLELVFETQIRGWMRDHWELTVTKIAPSAFARSNVIGLVNNSNLDSNDIVGVHKGALQKQRASVHEFGHMLGLGDEYAGSNRIKSWLGIKGKHESDLESVMNSGETIRPRHYKTLKDWVDANLP